MKPPSPAESSPVASLSLGALNADQLNQLLDNSAVIIAVKDLHGRHIYVNQPFAALLGGDVDDYLGKTDSEIFSDDLSRRLRADDAAVLRLGTGQSFEDELAIGEQQRIFNTRKFPLFGADGVAVGIGLMASDVTIQRRTELALERIALSVSSATGPEVFDLIVANLAGALGVDFAFIARITETEPETLQALSTWCHGELVEPTCYTSAGTPCATALSTGFTFISGDLQQAYPGDPLFEKLNFRSYAGFPLTGADGQPTGVLSICHSGPLTDAGLVAHLLRIFSVRASAELQRADTEAALRATIDAALDAIIVMDSAGRVVGCNPAAVECFGWQPDDIRGRVLADLIIPERHREAFREGLERHLRTGQSELFGRRSEIRALRRDGSEFPAELTVAVSPGRDGSIFIGYLRDISERKASERRRVQLETQLRQAQKMEAIGRLVGGIAHDFNNILTGAMGYLGLARDAAAARDEGGDDRVRLDRYLLRATESAGRAVDLIRQLLTFSRGGVGNPELLDLVRVVRHSTGLLHSSIPHSIELELQLDATVPPVFLDPVQAEQVLLNLCINARDAMNGQGRIRIRLSTRRVEAHTCDACHESIDGNFVELSVEDFGPGVSEEVRHRIFEPFFSTKPTGHGHGMGLAIVHGIVHEQGGHLNLRSEPGRGATFSVLLPVHRAQQHQRSVAPHRSPDYDKLHGRVLVVDDEVSVGRFMVDLLETFGLEAAYQASPAAALAMLDCADAPADVVIVDYTMPEMTGIEFIEALRRRHPQLPALLYSGYVDRVPAESLARLDLPPPLEKPLHRAELLAALRRLMPS